MVQPCDTAENNSPPLLLLNIYPNKVKQSLTLVLVHFYPLTGRLKTLKSENPHSFVIFVDIKDSPGARIIHASLDMTVSDIVSATYVPVVIQSLSRPEPPLSQDYFGVSIGGVSGRATADELLEHDLGWAAWKLHQAVVGYTDKTVLESLDSWRKSPIIYKAGEMNNPRLVWMGSSPRFNKPINLTPWDLAMLSVQYIQKGHLYTKPAVDDQEEFINTLLDKLKQPLSLTLVHFYPLVDRFKTVKSEDTKSCLVFVDLNDSPGAKLIHASSDMTVSDIVSLTYVPLFVQSLFDHERAINHDGHTSTLVTIQVVGKFHHVGPHM
ncbi:hypothetical protein QYF36_021035 [Acer negundo]|nr:hypothetical protein QYF36_021035 [Acer negundo]